MAWFAIHATSAYYSYISPKYTISSSLIPIPYLYPCFYNNHTHPHHWMVCLFSCLFYKLLMDGSQVFVTFVSPTPYQVNIRQIVSGDLSGVCLDEWSPELSSVLSRIGESPHLLEEGVRKQGRKETTYRAIGCRGTCLLQ